MQKIGIKIIENEEVSFREIAKELQPFIIEGDYRLIFIMKELQSDNMLFLDVSNEENMPNLEEVLGGLEEDEVAYQLYQKVEESWEEVALEDLNLDRHPMWLNYLVGFFFLAYFIISFIEIFAIYDWYTLKYDLNGVFSLIGATITAYTPIIGSLVAYWSATELWEWDKLMTFIFYFFYYLPFLAFIIYLIWIILKALFEERWHRFWHSEFNRY